MRQDLLQLHELELVALNDAFRSIQERLERIMGINGSYTNGNWEWNSSKLKYVDENGTIIHSYGEI